MFRAACLVFLACVAALRAPVARAAAEIDPHSVKIEEKKDPARVEFRFRLTEPEAVTGVEATVGGRKLVAQFTPFAQQEGGSSTATLFLIDRSDPKRARTIEAVKGLIARLLERAEPGAKFAIHAFASDLEPVAEFGATKEEALAKLKGVKASGMATELYRDTIEAIKVLERQEAARRALVVFSDGRAEDTTFTLDQCVAKAHETGVTIFAVGYAEAPQWTTHLQSLRRLAAETGGQFVEADIATKKEPEAFARDFFGYLQSGGTAVVELPAAKPGDMIEFAVQTKDDRVLKHSHTLAAGEPTKADTRTPPAPEHKNRLWLIVSVVAVLLVLAAGACFALLQSARKTAPESPRHIYARLKVLDAEGTEHVMSATALRLGRGADNDVTLRNDSISRHHAEIHRTRDGSFAITDLGAGNGVLVNGEKVTQATLKHEDIIELGEVRLRFLIS